MSKYEDLPKVVQEVGKLNITGNVIPALWFQNFRYKNGRPHFPAILILSELVYWYRPKEERDEKTGQVISYRKRFQADKLQMRRKSFCTKFGLGMRQVKDALAFLKADGIMTTETRTIKTDNTILSNVLFLDLNVDRLAEVTFTELHQGWGLRCTEARCKSDPTYTQITNTKNTNTQNKKKKEKSTDSTSITDINILDPRTLQSSNSDMVYDNPTLHQNGFSDLENKEPTPSPSSQSKPSGISSLSEEELRVYKKLLTQHSDLCTLEGLKKWIPIFEIPVRVYKEYLDSEFRGKSEHVRGYDKATYELQVLKQVQKELQAQSVLGEVIV